MLVVKIVDIKHIKDIFGKESMKEKMDMIETWLISGDKHGNFSTMFNSIEQNYLPEKTAIIILGDAGINFWLNKTDHKWKKK